MALFPDLGTIYLDEKDRGLREQLEQFYQDNVTINQTFWTEADFDTRVEAGDQTVWNDLGQVPSFRRKQLSFNRIRPVKNMIGGYQRKNRKSIIVTPVENGDQETADQFTKVIMWSSQQDNILETVSEAFDGALVTGLNLLQVWLDFRNDPISGNIRVDNCSYNSFIIDSYFRKADLSDCNGIWKRSFLSKSECISLLPTHKDEIEELPTSGAKQDGKFPWMPESYQNTNLKLFTYDEYYYRTYRKQKILVDTRTGESMEWQQDNPEGLKRFLQQYPEIIEMDQEIPTVRLAIFVQGKVLFDGPNPLNIDDYPFVPVFGYFNPQMPSYSYRIQGVVRGLRDAQLLYNRRKVSELDIVESQVNSGYIYKENALVNPKDIFLSGQGKGIAIKESAQITDVMKIPAPEIPQSMIQLSDILAKEISMISGVNEELLGAAVDDKAGILSMLRQGAGLTTLQILFDNLDRSQKLLGKLMINVIQSNFTPGKIAKIIEDEPMPQFYNKAFGKYDAAVEDGFNTTTQRQMQFAQLLQLREAGVPIPDDQLIEAATLQNKKELTDSIARTAQQQQELAQAQAQVELENQQAVIRSLDAKATSDKGLAIERVSRVEENQQLAVERLAEAQKDRMAGILDLVKALKEIESIDIEQVERLVALAQVLKKKEAVEAQQPISSSMMGNLDELS
jgi:hypothetical protein